MTQSTSVRLSVVIVNFFSLPDLRGCLQSIKRHNDIGDALEVVVVEQSDGAAEAPQICREFPWVKLIVRPNRGFGAGNNAGAQNASGEILLFLNPDTLLVQPVFKQALWRFQSDANLGLFGLRLQTRDGTRAQSFYFLNPLGIFRGRIWRLLDRFDIFLSSSMYITGADLFVRRTAFETVGGFDERMFLYHEEADLCSRLRQHHFQIAYVPEFRLTHLEGTSTKSDKVFKYRVDSYVLLAEKMGWNVRRQLKKWGRQLFVRSVLHPNDPTVNKEQMILRDRLRMYDEQSIKAREMS